MRFTLAAISIRATSEGLRSCGGSTSMSPSLETTFMVT